MTQPTGNGEQKARLDQIMLPQFLSPDEFAFKVNCMVKKRSYARMKYRFDATLAQVSCARFVTKVEFHKDFKTQVCPFIRRGNDKAGPV